MRISRTVRQASVKHGNEWTLTVSTIQTGFRAYETTVFDDTPDKRLEGWLLGDRVIETTVDKASTHEEAMDQHREALYEARTETPRPQSRSPHPASTSPSRRPCAKPSPPRRARPPSRQGWQA